MSLQKRLNVEEMKNVTYLKFSEESDPAPYPKLLAKSLPVPKGNKVIAGGFSSPILSTVLSTQLTVRKC